MAEPITINIQWKGSQVCLDFVCPGCGAAFHVDTDCETFIECSGCGTVTDLPNELPLPDVKA